MNFLITGGAGFIGSALVRFLIKNTDHNVLNIDSLTYAGNLQNLTEVSDSDRLRFLQEDICNFNSIKKSFNEFKPDIVMHLAAESHVDKSIDGPNKFITTNIIGTSILLECAREYWSKLDNTEKKKFIFHHISTDEVYGSLERDGLFTEDTKYDPSSPYSASKASSDHLVRAWNRTFGLPIIITNCSNNYGPYQFPEKLIPLSVLNAIEGNTIPVFGNGSQIRDWLYVDDHVEALYKVVTEGVIGETYNIGGNNEKTNLEVVKTICTILDRKISIKPNMIKSFSELITFVDDRPGHDQRYAIDATKILKNLKWSSTHNFEKGIEKTVNWIIANIDYYDNSLNDRKRQGRLI